MNGPTSACASPAGRVCDICERYPGCWNGTCFGAWGCDRLEGWGGLFCDQDLDFFTIRLSIFLTLARACDKRFSADHDTMLSLLIKAFGPWAFSFYQSVFCRIFRREGLRLGRKINNNLGPKEIIYRPRVVLYNTNHRPCKNGGTRYNTGQGNYTCVSAAGFTSTDCEIEKSGCEHQPCMNDGTCRDTDHNFTCVCPRGWSGHLFETAAKTCSDQAALSERRGVLGRARRLPLRLPCRVRRSKLPDPHRRLRRV